MINNNNTGVTNNEFARPIAAMSRLLNNNLKKTAINLPEAKNIPIKEANSPLSVNLDFTPAKKVKSINAKIIYEMSEKKEIKKTMRLPKKRLT